MVPRITFGMPLRSRRVSRNWQLCCALLDDSLTSILTPARENVVVYVACHELPDSCYLNDPRVRFLQQSTPVPTSIPEQTIDKELKLRALAHEVCRNGEGYLVLMDADDIVSNRLIDYIRANDNRCGYSIEQGYVVNVRTRQVDLVKNFPRYCGSSSVFYLKPQDIDNGNDGFIDAFVKAGHMHFKSVAKVNGRPLEPIAFPAMLYLRHHGDNLSVSSRPWYRFTEWRYWVVEAAAKLLRRPKLSEAVVRDFVIRTDPFKARRLTAYQPTPSSA